MPANSDNGQRKSANTEIVKGFNTLVKQVVGDDGYNVVVDDTTIPNKLIITATSKSSKADAVNNALGSVTTFVQWAQQDFRLKNKITERQLPSIGSERRSSPSSLEVKLIFDVSNPRPASEYATAIMENAATIDRIRKKNGSKGFIANTELPHSIEKVVLAFKKTTDKFHRSGEIFARLEEGRNLTLEYSVSVADGDLGKSEVLHLHQYMLRSGMGNHGLQFDDNGRKLIMNIPVARPDFAIRQYLTPRHSTWVANVTDSQNPDTKELSKGPPVFVLLRFGVS